MSLSKNEVMNELYNAGLISLGAVATSMVSRKLAKDGLGVTTSAQSVLKLAAAVGGGSVFRCEQRPRRRERSPLQP